MREDFEAELPSDLLAYCREQGVVGVVARPGRRGRYGRGAVGIGVTMRHPAHQVAVEQGHGVPVVQQPVKAVGFHRLKFDRITIQVEPGRILAHAEDVRRLTAERSVLEDERVRAVNVEGQNRRDDHNLVVEERPPGARS